MSLCLSRKTEENNENCSMKFEFTYNIRKLGYPGRCHNHCFNFNCFMLHSIVEK